jgi:hypothetical protein
MKPTFLISLTLFVTLSSPNLSATPQKSTQQQQEEGLPTPQKNKSQKCKKDGREFSLGETYDKEGTKYICRDGGKWEIQRQS